MEVFQHTLNDTAFFQGVGLHSGKLVDVIVSPAPENTGISFQRSDVKNAKPIPANALLVASTDLCTTLEQEGLRVATIEHLMASLFGMGIDNAFIQVNSPEMPILDGSGAPYLDTFRVIGLKEQSAKRTYYKILRSFTWELNGSKLRVDPASQLIFDCTIEFDNSKAIGKQHLRIPFTRSHFLKIADARTFCHMKDVDAMRKVGLALGGSLDNAVVVDDDSVLNAEGLRHPDEFVRHKLLDLVGDLYLLGHPIIGLVTAVRGGHGLHAAFMKALLANKTDVFARVTLDQASPQDTHELLAVQR
jgi:UDP-3-O-[3-hydroxymyristoyl] N-acetylglucosamine deacetylase